MWCLVRAPVATVQRPASAAGAADRPVICAIVQAVGAVAAAVAVCTRSSDGSQIPLMSSNCVAGTSRDRVPARPATFAAPAMRRRLLRQWVPRPTTTVVHGVDVPDQLAASDDVRCYCCCCGDPGKFINININI